MIHTPQQETANAPASKQQDPSHINSSLKFWIPAGDLTEGQAMLLVVPATAKPDRQMYQALLAQKLQDLVDQSPEQARAAMEMSPEHLPEMYLIGLEQPRAQWGISLTNSDSMGSLLSRLDWTQPGQLTIPSGDDLEIHPQRVLQSLLEQLQ